jgi:hypothetical protein
MVLPSGRIGALTPFVQNVPIGRTIRPVRGKFSCRCLGYRETALPDCGGHAGKGVNNCPAEGRKVARHP